MALEGGFPQSSIRAVVHAGASDSAPGGAGHPLPPDKMALGQSWRRLRPLSSWPMRWLYQTRCMNLGIIAPAKAWLPSCKIRRFEQILLKNVVIQYNCSFLYAVLAEKWGSNQARGQALTFLRELTQDFISMPSTQAQVCLKLRPKAH